MFHTIFYEPIYNLLVFVLSNTPLHDIGIAIIIVTLVVKFILLPLNISALRTQYLMKRLEPEMAKIRELQKKDPREASQKMMDLYKKEKLNPFAGILGPLLQIPVIIALYQVFFKGMHNDPTSLYTFLSFPESLHTLAFGFFDMTQKSIILAVLAGISSFMLARRQTTSMVTKKASHEETFQDQLMKSMRIQILYVLPVITTVMSAFFPSAIALYFVVSNTIGYGQDIYMKNKLAHLKPL
jgi:YidC/Oxa1 family membrane protein insertase